MSLASKTWNIKVWINCDERGDPLMFCQYAVQLQYNMLISWACCNLTVISVFISAPSRPRRSDVPDRKLTSDEEEARRIAEMGKPVLGENSKLEVIIEESYEFKVGKGSSSNGAKAAWLLQLKPVFSMQSHRCTHYSRCHLASDSSYTFLIIAEGGLLLFRGFQSTQICISGADSGLYASSNPLNHEYTHHVCFCCVVFITCFCCLQLDATAIMWWSSCTWSFFFEASTIDADFSLWV